VPKVLLIDDDPGDSRLLGLTLSNARGGPWELRRAESLAEGFKALESFAADAVLLDLGLPDSKGLETLRRFRAEARGTPVIVMTGLDDERTAEDALAHGAQDYLIKGTPGADALGRCLRYAIARGRLESLREEHLHNVNHELRSPLTAVYGALSMLHDTMAGPLNKHQTELVRLAFDGVTHLLDMTNDLSEVLRSENGKLEVKPRRVDLTPTIGELLSLIGHAEEAKGKILRAELPSDLPAAHADPVRLKQILLNLLDNALKFTPAGGTIAVRAEVSPEESGFVRVAVADTGPGIAPAQLRKLFGRLDRTERPASEYRAGLGLGLYLCRELVAGHGGRIWAESAPGRGATFWFTLPVAP
jgi:signal transduction histidine kinase